MTKTIDKILDNGKRFTGTMPPAKGSAQWAQQQGRTQAVSAPKGTMSWAQQNTGRNTATSAASKATSAMQPTGASSSGESHTDALKRSGISAGMTEQQRKEAEKKYRRNQTINAIGDGLYALSNLYFTTKGAPDMSTAKGNATPKAKVNFDKMMEDDENRRLRYYSMYTKAKAADDAKNENERNWRHKIDIFNYGKERDRAADERYEEEKAYERRRAEEARKADEERWKKSFDQKERQHKDDMEIERGRNAATAARGVRGKRIGFADGDGNQVGIYENVWKGSMQQVFDAMVSDLAPADETKRKRFEREMKKLDTSQKKEDYVKQNWHKSPKASQIMLTLSKLDPATMTSELNDEVVDYEPEEVIDYVPGNK